MIVVDSNVLAARCLTTERTGLAQAVERKDPVWIVPPLWRYELQNILVKTVWAGDLGIEEAGAVWRRLEDQMAGNEHEPDPLRVIEVATARRISGYDANFIVLALGLGIPCVTEDGGLQRKFPGLAHSMSDFLGLPEDLHQ